MLRAVKKEIFKSHIRSFLARKDIYVLEQFLKHLFDKHVNMGVIEINVPQSRANRLHLWIWHGGNQRI